MDEPLATERNIHMTDTPHDTTLPDSSDQSVTSTPVVEGEVIENAHVGKEAFDINSYNAVLEVVRRRLSILSKSEEEIKVQKEMLSSLFENDPGYQEADAQVKEISKKKLDAKARIGKTPQAQTLAAKIKELSDEIKNNKEMLSDELMQYYQTAGVTEIEDSDGNIQEFEIKVKLKGKRKAA